MDVISSVKNVFLLIMGTTVAMILYFIFFGVHLAQYGDWEGVLWWSARQVEIPISRYYYEYTYLPNICGNDYVDEALGGIPLYSDLNEVTADLSDDASTVTTFPDYTTGWK